MKRAFTIGAAAVVLLALRGGTGMAQAFDPLPAVDLAKLSPADFSDDELDTPAGGNNASEPMPYLLAHFKTLADGVSDGSGELPRGFIGVSVWRAPHDNKPHNMRIMENQLSLVYFYVTDRPWNVYRGHPALRQRLEAALQFMIDQQGPRGEFSEYQPKKWGVAPTAFATKFLGQSLTLLTRPGAPPIDAKLLERTFEMDRKAINVILDDPAFYEHGKRFTNQFGNIWAGGLAYLALRPGDAELREKLGAKHAASVNDFFSPPGYPYENDGPDWSYNLGTHASNQRMARFYTHGAAALPGTESLGQRFVEEERCFHEWLGYNAVPISGQPGYVLNRAIETRGSYPFRGPMESNFADALELVRAFAPTDAEVAARRAAARKKAEQTWPTVAPLPIGDFKAYSPYNFLHREHPATHPTAAQRDAARALIPYVADDTFNHQRVDTRSDPSPAYTFVRRPGYYAAVNTGHQQDEQRLGLGLLWNPALGALMQSQSGSTEHAWGTRPAAASSTDDADKAAPYEAATLPARFTVADKEITPTPGARDLPDGDLVVTYPLGTAGKKEIRFLADRIEVRVTHPGDFREQIPLLLLPNDQLRAETDSITLGRGHGSMQIQPTGAARVAEVKGDAKVGPYRVTSVQLDGKDQLTYTIRIANNP
jgi:hypothetical protein